MNPGTKCATRSKHSALKTQWISSFTISIPPTAK
jgi:hypothetical protein